MQVSYDVPSPMPTGFFDAEKCGTVAPGCAPFGTHFQIVAINPVTPMKTPFKNLVPPPREIRIQTGHTPPPSGFTIRFSDPALKAA
jgi:hypothetical protein